MPLQQNAIPLWWRGSFASVTLKGLLLRAQPPDWAKEKWSQLVGWTNGNSQSGLLLLLNLSLDYLTCKQMRKYIVENTLLQNYQSVFVSAFQNCYKQSEQNDSSDPFVICQMLWLRLD